MENVSAVVNKPSVFRIVDQHTLLACIKDLLLKTLASVQADAMPGKPALLAWESELSKWKVVCANVTALAGIVMANTSNEEKDARKNYCVRAFESIRGQNIKINEQVLAKLTDVKDGKS
jgi:hypothetical protein